MGKARWGRGEVEETEQPTQCVILYWILQKEKGTVFITGTIEENYKTDHVSDNMNVSMLHFLKG